MIPRVAARVQASASGRLSPGSGQVPISAGKITGPAGLGPNRALKPQVAPCPPWLGPSRKGTCGPARTCILEHVCASVSGERLCPWLPPCPTGAWHPGLAGP